MEPTRQMENRLIKEHMMQNLEADPNKMDCIWKHYEIEESGQLVLAAYAPKGAKGLKKFKKQNKKTW